MFFEKLIDLIVHLWGQLIPCQIIRVFETAAVLRFGKFHRVAAPGLLMKWPVVEEVIAYDSVVTTLRLPPQTLTTKDDIGVVTAAIIKYRVVDVEAYVTQIWDQHDVLADVTMGLIQKTVKDLTWEELRLESPERKILDSARRAVEKYGFKLDAITFTDLGRVRSLRLIQQAAPAHNHEHDSN